MGDFPIPDSQLAGNRDREIPGRFPIRPRANGNRGPGGGGPGFSQVVWFGREGQGPSLDPASSGAVSGRVPRAASEPARPSTWRAGAALYGAAAALYGAAAALSGKIRHGEAPGRRGQATSLTPSQW